GGTPAPGPSASAEPGAPLIGREHHLEALAAAFRTMKRGRTVICSVQGPSGVGKSALIHRFLDDLPTGTGADAGADVDTVVLAGRCYEQESVPYKAFDS